MDTSFEADVVAVSVATAVIGQRGRLIVPIALQRAAGITEGTRVVLRATADGTITVEPTWTVVLRLRSTVGSLLPPQGPVSVRWGGRPGLRDGVRPTDPLLPASAVRSVIDRGLGHAEADGTDTLAVLTAGAVLGWLAAAEGCGPGSPADALLPHGVLPEQAVGELVTALVRAGLLDQVDDVLTDLRLLGLSLSAPGDGHPDLAHDTATALRLVADATQRGAALEFTDALCTAIALRLGVLLLAADPAPAVPDVEESPTSASADLPTHPAEDELLAAVAAYGTMRLSDAAEKVLTRLRIVRIRHDQGDQVDSLLADVRADARTLAGRRLRIDDGEAGTRLSNALRTYAAVEELVTGTTSA
ncbi:AbrB/MazE/SpoVT family DNA-binding domain-containing protein [Kitasatospora sp. CB02891]|uniref:AbrB/MazE/SpoVT family DNA-binding domain-containing protein n=1 Tax=Kitasatospora sp. CB02891 TaxID=2020329 RepID=UPI000C272E01|nr:AbrB/MazE/SpoVT family DNA-binding domain-containing protein [Kitasatospora sp. CB02891]